MKIFRLVLLSVAIAAFAFPASAQTVPVFEPPSSWTQVPRGFMLTEIKNIWNGPKRRNGREIFAQAVLPVPAALLTAAIAQAPLKSAARGARKICGNAGMASVFRVGKGKDAALLDAEVFSHNGLTYAAVYARPLGVKANASIQMAQRNFCPTAAGDVPSGAMPAGWEAVAKGIDFELSGIWLGNSPFQVISLVQGRALPAPDMLAQMLPSKTVRKGVQVQYSVTTRKTKFCGQDGTTVSVKFGGSGFNMNYDLAATQVSGVSYLLSYLHPSDMTDNDAKDSLTTLCAAPPPSPASTPSGLVPPLPTPIPTATP